MEPLPSFGRYEALFRIAAGGMAEVFAARIRGEAGFEKLVAVKRMLPHLVEDEHFVDMFLDEAKLAVHVSSPHVVQTLDLGRAPDGALYIVMELVVGASIATLIKEARKRGSRVPIPIALEIMAQAAQGLDDAHEAVTPTGVQLGIVHRDVSPHNLLVGVDGRARVTDFGIARAMLRRTSTAVGELKGKFAYFSPEQAEGHKVDRRADVFALGICAWESMVGRRLFTGDDSLEILKHVKSQPIAMVHELDDEVPHAVSLVIAKALERNPDRRYATAADFSHALREAARSIGPTPSAREIGRWVNESAGETLVRVRTLIDNALAGDEVPTISKRVPSGQHPQPVSLVQPKATPAPPIVHEPGVSTVGATTFAAEVTRRNRGRKVTIATLAIVGAAAIFVFVYASQRSNPSNEAVPAATPAFPQTPAIESKPIVPTTTSASTPAAASHVVSHPKLPIKAPTIKPPPIPSTAAPTATAVDKPAPTATEAPPPPKKGPSGPLLPDEAFKKDG